MKYFSELLNKPFDTEADCIKAEKEYKEEQSKISKQLEAALAEKKAKEEAEQKSKKELSKVIEEATKEKAEAEKLYEVAQAKAQKIKEDAKIEANKILSAAADKVKEAEQKRVDAVVAYNKKFGAYTTVLTGEKAADEYNKTLQRLNGIIKDFWNTLWF